MIYFEAVVECAKCHGRVVGVLVQFTGRGTVIRPPVNPPAGWSGLGPGDCIEGDTLCPDCQEPRPE